MTIPAQVFREDVRLMRQALVERFLAAGATSPQSTLEIPPESLSSDQNSLLADFVRRGIVEEYRGAYYLNEDAYAREARRGSWRLYVGLTLLGGIVGAMLWYSRGLK